MGAGVGGFIGTGVIGKCVRNEEDKLVEACVAGDSVVFGDMIGSFFGICVVDTCLEVKIRG